MDRDSSRAIQQGIDSMSVEALSIATLGKWFLGGIAFPWVWWVTKRQMAINKDYYTKDEVKEKIEDKLAPIQTDIQWIRKHLEDNK